MLRRDLTTGTGRTWSGGRGWDWTTRLGRAGRERGGGEDCEEREREGGEDNEEREREGGEDCEETEREGGEDNEEREREGGDEIEAPGGHSTGCER